MPDLKDLYSTQPKTLVTQQEQDAAGVSTYTPIMLLGREVPGVQGRLLEEVDSRYQLGGIEAVHEIAARNQNWAEQWSNGVIKFIGKTGTAAVGSTIGMADGIIEAVVNWDFSKVYDNHVMNYLDGLNKAMDEALPNLRTKVEEEMSLGRQMLTSNFWADDFLGGASFLAGAVLAEVLTGGAATPAIVARAGSLLKTTGRAKTVGEGLTKAQQLSMLGKTGVALKSTTIGAGYESAVETLSARNEIRDKLVSDYQKKNGVEPDVQKLEEFTNIANEMANGVFAANFVTVGAGNAIFMTKLFGAPLKNLIPARVSNMFGKGLSNVDGTLVDKSVTGWRKYLTAGKRFIVNPGTEGVQEILQGIYQSSALDYTMQKYSHDGADASYSMIGALLDNGLDKLNPANMSKDQLKEGLIGALLGVIGLPGTGSFLESFKSGAQALKGKSQYQDIIDHYNTMTPNVKESLKGFIRQAEINKATNNQTLFDAKNAESLSFFNFLGSRYNAGYINDVVDDVETQLNTLNDTEFASMFGYDKMSKDEIKQRKEDIITKTKDMVKEYKTARDRAERLDYTGSEEVQEGLAYVLFGIKDLDKRFDSIIESLEEKGIGASNMKGLIMRGNSIKFRQASIKDKQNTLDKVKADKEAFVKENKRKAAGYKAAITRHSKVVNSSFEESPAKAKLDEYENTLKGFDDLITKQEKELAKYEKAVESLIAKQKEARGTSEIDRDLEDYSKFEREIKHYMDLSPGEKQDLKEQIQDLNLIQIKRQNLIDELELLSNPKSQKLFDSKIKELKDRINKEYEQDINKTDDKVDKYLTQVKSRMEQLEQNIQLSKNKDKTKKFQKELDNLKKQYEAFENIEMQSMDIDTLKSSMNQVKKEFSSTLFKNMYDVIRAGKKINGEITPEELDEAVDAAIFGEVPEVKKDVKGNVFSSFNEFFIVYQGNMNTDPYLYNEDGELKPEVKKAMEEYEKGSPATLTFTPVTDEAKFLPIQTQGNPNIFINRGITVNGKQYLVNVKVNGVDIGGLMNPNRYVELNNQNEFVELDLTTSTDLKKLTSIQPGSEEHKQFINQYKALQNYWENVIEYNITEGRTEVPFTVGMAGDNFSAYLNVYTIGWGTEFRNVKDMSEWHVEHDGKKKVYAEIRGDKHVLEDGKWRKYDPKTDKELSDRYASAKKATNKNNKLGEKGSMGILLNVNGSDQIFPVQFSTVEDTSEEAKQVENFIKEKMELVKQKDDSSEDFKMDSAKFTLGIKKDGSTSWVSHSSTTLSKTKFGLAITLQSPAFGEKKGSDYGNKIYINIYQNKSRQYYLSYGNGKDVVTATIGDAPTLNNILSALEFKPSKVAKSIFDTIKAQYGLDMLTINLKEEGLDNMSSNLVTNYSASFVVKDNTIASTQEKTYNKESSTSSIPKESSPKTPTKKATTKTYKPPVIKEEESGVSLESMGFVSDNKDYEDNDIKSKKADIERRRQEIEDFKTEAKEDISTSTLGNKGQRWGTIIRVHQKENNNLTKQFKLTDFETKESLAKEIDKIYNAELKALEETTPAPQSEIDTKKAEIEKRRQEKLSKVGDENIPKEIQEFFNIDDSEDYESLSSVAIESESPAAQRELAEIPKIPVTQETTSQSTERIEDIDIPFSIRTSTTVESTFEKEARQVERVLGNVPIRDIKEILRNVANRGITMGAFAKGIVYLAKDKIEKGTGLHEAFHYVFRSFLSESELDSIYAQAEERYGKPTKDEIKNFRGESSTRKNMSERDLELLWYEEKMADEFSEYDNKGFWSKLFTKIKNLIKKWVGAANDIELLFQNIDSGVYRNRNSKYQSDGVAFSLKGVNIRKNAKNEHVPVLAGIGSRDAKMVASLIFQQMSKGYAFGQALEYVRNRFHPSNWADVAQSINDNYKLLTFTDRIYGIYTALSEDIEYRKTNGAKLTKAANTKYNENIIELRKMVKAYEVIFKKEEDSDQSEDERDETTELFSRGSDRNMGFNSTSKVFRQYIANVYSEYDYFGLGIEAQGAKHNFPADVDVLYSALINMSRNMPEDKILPALLMRKSDNQNIAIFVDKWVRDIESELGETIQGKTHEQLKESQWYVTVVKGITRVEENYVDAVIIPPGRSVKYTRIKFYNSNQTDTEQIQKDNWYASALTKNLTGDEVIEIWDTVQRRFDDLTFDQINTDAKLDAYIVDIQDMISPTGIELSKSYIKLGLLRQIEDDVRKSDNNAYKDYLDTFDHVETALDGELSKNILAGYKSVIKENKHHSEAFLKNEKEAHLGASGRIMNLAKGNAYFNENARKTTIKNSTGENIYPIKLPSFDANTVNTWKREGHKFLNDPTLETLKEMFPGYSVLDEQGNEDDSLLSDYYDSLMNNILIQDAILNRVQFWNLFGVRNDMIEGEAYQKLYDSAAEYSEMDASGKMFVKMSMYIDSPLSATKDNYRLFVPAVLEAKNTAKAVELHVGNFSKSGKLTDEGREAIKKRVLAEHNRIEKAKRLLTNFINGIEPNVLVEDYHYTTTKSGKMIFKLDGEFYEIKDNQVLQNTVTEKEKESYREIRAFNRLEFPTLDINSTDAEYDAYVQDRFEKFRDSLVEHGLIKEKDGEYTNRLLPVVKNSSHPTNITNVKGEIYMDKLYEFYVSDFINSMHFMSMLYGNISMQHKDTVDIVKRNGGLIAAGENLGSAVAAYIKTQTQDLAQSTHLSDEAKELLSKNNKDTKQDIQDAQTYTSTAWFVNKYLKETGRKNKKVVAIAKKLRAGVPLSKEEFEYMQDQTSTALDKKIVARDLFTYIKTSAHTQFRETFSYSIVSEKELLQAWDDYDKGVKSIDEVHALYKAYPNYEYHHAMINAMERTGIEMVVVTSAGKGARINVGQWNGTDFELKNFNVPEIREQVKMETIKDKIVHGTQLMGLIDAEHDDTVITTLNGKSKKTSDLAKAYRKQLAKRVSFGLNEMRSNLYKNGKIDYDMLDEEFDNSINASKPDPMLSEMAKVENGEPVYSWNLSAVSSKFQQIFHKFVSTNTLKFKVAGTKYTLTSSYGMNVIVDENDNVIPTKQWNKKGKPKVRPLKWAVRQGGVFYSEAIVPQWILDKHNIKLGQEISDPMLLFQMGIRIPTQDKHSMVTIKVVDTISSMNESSIFLPNEIVFLSGADFDIDSLFARLWAVNKMGKRFGQYTTMLEAYEEFVEDKPSKKRISFSEFKEKYENQVTNNIKHREAFNLDEIEPLTLKEADNILLELEMNLIMNEGNKNIAATKASLDLFKDNEDGAIAYFKKLGLISQEEATGIYDALSKNQAQENNDVGKEGIGPVAVFNILFQKLVRAKVKYDEEIFGRNDIPLINEEGKRINDIISTVLSAMTDNAKERIAAHFGLTPNTLGTFMTIVSTGMPFKEALLIMKQPAIVELEKQLVSQQRTIKTEAEEKDELKGKNKMETAHLRTIRNLNLSTEEMEGYQPKNMLNSLEKREGDKFQMYVLNEYMKAYEMAQEHRNAAVVIGLIKGLKPTIGDNKIFTSSLKALGAIIDIAPSSESIQGVKFDGNVVHFNKGDKYFKATLEAAPDKYFAEVLRTDEHLMNEVLAYAVLNEDVSEVFIRAHSKFQGMVESILPHINKYTSKDELSKMEDYLVNYLNVLAYQKAMGQKSPEMDTSFLTDKTEDGEFKLHHMLRHLKAHPFYGKMPLIRMMKEMSSKHANVAKIGIDTMSETSPEFKKSLLDDFVKLLDLNIPYTDNPQTSAEVARYFAQNMFNYTFMMDNMTYRNNSLVKALDPIVWKKFSIAMKDVEKIFIDGKAFNSQLGISKEKILNEFIELYLRNPNRSENRIFVSNSAIKNSKGRSVFVEIFNQGSKMVDVKGENWFKTSDDKIVLDFSSQGRSSKSEVDWLTPAHKKDAESFGLYTPVVGGGIAPILFKQKVSDKLTRLMRLEKINVNEDGKFKQYVRQPDGTAKVFIRNDKEYVETSEVVETMPQVGYKFEYAPVTQVLSKDFLGFAQSVQQAEQFTVEIAMDNAEDEVVPEVIERTEGNSTKTVVEPGVSVINVVESKKQGIEGSNYNLPTLGDTKVPFSEIKKGIATLIKVAKDNPNTIFNVNMSEFGRGPSQYLYSVIASQFRDISEALGGMPNNLRFTKEWLAEKTIGIVGMPIEGQTPTQSETITPDNPLNDECSLGKVTIN
jgi:hypothetical protein